MSNSEAAVGVSSEVMGPLLPLNVSPVLELGAELSLTAGCSVDAGKVELASLVLDTGAVGCDVALVGEVGTDVVDGADNAGVVTPDDDTASELAFESLLRGFSTPSDADSLLEATPASDVPIEPSTCPWQAATPSKAPH